MPALSEVPRAAMTANRGRRDQRGGDRRECRRRSVEQPLSGGRLLEDLVSQPHAIEPVTAGIQTGDLDGQAAGERRLAHRAAASASIDGGRMP